MTILAKYVEAVKVTTTLQQFGPLPRKTARSASRRSTQTRDSLSLVQEQANARAPYEASTTRKRRAEARDDNGNDSAAINACRREQEREPWPPQRVDGLQGAGRDAA